MTSVIATMRSRAKLPVGQRGGLSDVRAGATDSPRSKVAGEPKDVLHRSEPNNRPAPIFGPAFMPALVKSASVAKPAPPNPVEMMQARAGAEESDRVKRFRAAPRPKLGVSKKSGLERAKNAQEKPRLPGGRPGLFARTRVATNRGTTYGQTVVPAGVTEKLAASAVIAEKVRPALLPVSQSSAPVMVMNVNPVEKDAAPQVVVQKPAEMRADIVDKAGSGGPERFLFLAAAVVVAFLAFRG